MRSLALFLITGLTFATFAAGCAGASEDTASSDDEEVNARYADPGADLGRTTHVVADLDGTATFSVYDRALERRTAGKVEPIAKVDAGYTGLVVAKDFIAVLTSSWIQGGANKTSLHIYARALAWKETAVDLSSASEAYHHPIALLEDDSIAVGDGEDLHIVKADGTKVTLGGATSALHGLEIAAIYPSGNAGHPFVGTDRGATYDVAVKTKSEKLLPSIDVPPPGERAYDVASKTWVVRDFKGLKVYDAGGHLLRKADLVSPKGRYLTAMAVSGDAILTVQDSEKSMDRSVLASYALADLARTELGTFDGRIGELSPRNGQLGFTFSPKGAKGFNSRVYYAHLRKM